MMYLKNRIKDAEDNKLETSLCEHFLEKSSYTSPRPRLGCCTQLIKRYSQMETLVQQMFGTEAAQEEVLPLITQKGTREYRHFTYLMERFSECKSEVIEIDKIVKTGCGRDDFIQPATMPPMPTIPPPKFQEKKDIDMCPECLQFFNFKRPKRHCRYCLRVVCAACTVKKVFEEDGRKIRLCLGCVTYVATNSMTSPR